MSLLTSGEPEARELSGTGSFTRMRIAAVVAANLALWAIRDPFADDTAGAGA